ncbi:MAG: nickel-type superoxide dismutase maturation protease [Candidatus Limnocylindria bacterium]
MVAGIVARLLAVAAGAAAFTVATRDLDAVAVRGRSMAPSLLPGDRLIVRRRRSGPRVGDVVVVRDPRRPDRELIKRVAAVDGARVTLLGDNPAGSTDAREFGPVAASGVRWGVVVRYWPPSRVGPLPNSISTGSDPAAHALSRSPSRQP